MGEEEYDKIFEAEKAYRNTVKNMGNPNETNPMDVVFQAEQARKQEKYANYTPESFSIIEGSATTRGMYVKGASEMFRLLDDNWIQLNR